MGSATIEAIRSILRDLDKPLTGRERALLSALILRHDNADRDVLDLADAARRAMRYRIRATGGHACPELIALLSSVDALLDAPPDDRELAGVGARVPDQLERPFRRDIDG